MIWSAQAQQQPRPPAREGNIWGDVAHQPTRGEVQEQEKAVGIALPSQQQKTLNQDVDQLYRELVTREAPQTGRPDQTARRHEIGDWVIDRTGSRAGFRPRLLLGGADRESA